MKRSLFGLSVIGLLFAFSTSAQTEPAELARVTMTVDSLGIEHTAYQQQYQGIPVFGAQTKINYNPTSGVRFSTGKVASNVVVNVVPQVSADEAVSVAQRLSGQPNTTTLKKNLYIFDEHLLNKLKPETFTLVWQIELFQTKPLFHEFYFIDAQTGGLVYKIHGLQDALDRRIWDCSYGLTGDCYLDELDLSTGYLYGRSEGQVARGANPLNPNYLITSLNDTDDLYTNLGNIYDYYLTKFALDGANGNGGMGDGSSIYFPITGTVGLTYIDYYYLSESDYTSCPNAFFDGARAMHYCEGFVTNDISGHEYAHAVNYYSIFDANGDPAGLSYTNESGALNEANSDVFGEALEYDVTGSNDWLLGEDSPLGVMRSMSDPTAYTYSDDDGNPVPYPDSYNSENLYCGTADSGGVHLNSSVINKAAYLIAIGGTFNGCTLTGLGRDKEEAIFYRAQTTYYTTSTDFNGAYTALLASCHDLYSTDDCKQVEKALRATELNQAGFCSGEPAADPGCAEIDATPTIADVTSDTADGYYKAGKSIDIDVTFSEAVSGEVTVNLETGDTNRYCSFTIDGETTGTCDYTVQAGDTSDDLNVMSISGTITDSSGDTVAVGVLTTNLKANKAIVIDTTKPGVPTTLRIYTGPQKNRRIKTIHPGTFSGTVTDMALKPYFQWSSVTGVQKYYVKFSDKPNLKRSKLLTTSNLKTSTHLRGNVEQIGKKYYLYMILKDRAGNKSKVKTLVQYKTTL